MRNFNRHQNFTRNNFRPKKSLGQNFLQNKDIIYNIIDSANLKDTDTVLEVGPGKGILTEALCAKARLVLAVEKDYDLVRYLTDKFKNQKNLKIIHQDILFFNPETLEKGYKIVANLPYNITSYFLRKFLTCANKPQSLTLMLQKEVAERFCAKPGDSNRSILTIMVEFFTDAKIAFEVKKENFWPIPQVDSAVITLALKNNFPKIDEKLFFKFVKFGFSQKRRTILNSLSAGLHLSKDKVGSILKEAGLDEKLRAEDLNLDNWLMLARIYYRE